jgi:myosin heavy subunit
MADIDLNSPEVKDAIKHAVEEATTALAEKNRELLGELKTARKSLEIKPEDYNKLSDERDTLQEQLSALQKQIKQVTSDSEKIKKQYESESLFTHKLLVDNGLNDVLVKAGVSNPAMLKAVKSMMASQVQIVAEGDTRIAKVGDKALNEYVTEWAKSDEGKHFVSAQANNGGGAQGASGQGNAKIMTRAEFDKADHATRASFAKEGGRITD